MNDVARDEDRRQSRRLAADAHGITAVRIRPGHGATILDASAAGALLETSHRLLPGTPVELHMETGTERFCVRARVVRCVVAQVRAAAVRYRGAVAFDRHLPWFVAAEGYVVPGSEQRVRLAERADATRELV